MDVRTSIDAWAQELARCGRTPGHIHKAAKRVRSFVDGLPSPAWADVRPLAAVAWLRTLRGCPKTQASAASAVRTWGRWCAAMELVGRAPLDGIPMPRVRNGPGADAMTLDQLRRLIDAAELREASDGRCSRRGPLCSTLYRFLALTGLRVGEAASQRWDDVDLDRGTLTLTRDKSRRNDTIPLAAECVCTLRPWRWHSRGELVFPSMPSHHTIRRDLVAAGAGAGRGRFHRLRKTAVTLRAGEGVRLRELAKFARHTDERMTAGIYDRAELEALRPAAEALRIA